MKSLLSAVLTLTFALPAAASVPLAYTGRLLDLDTGTPLTGNYNVTFRIYNVAVSGTPLFEQTFAGGTAVAVADGNFYTLLDANEVAGGDDLEIIFGEAMANSVTLFLELEVNGETLDPRQPIGGVPFAHAVPVADPITQESGAVGLKACTDGQILTYNDAGGGSWDCVASSATLSLPTCAAGQYLAWNGASWTCTAPLPTSCSDATANPARGLLTWNGTGWTCAYLPRLSPDVSGHWLTTSSNKPLDAVRGTGIHGSGRQCNDASRGTIGIFELSGLDHLCFCGAYRNTRGGPVMGWTCLKIDDVE